MIHERRAKAALKLQQEKGTRAAAEYLRAGDFPVEEALALLVPGWQAKEANRLELDFCRLFKN